MTRAYRACCSEATGSSTCTAKRARTNMDTHNCGITLCCYLRCSGRGGRQGYLQRQRRASWRASFMTRMLRRDLCLEKVRDHMLSSPGSMVDLQSRCSSAAQPRPRPPVIMCCVRYICVYIVDIAVNHIYHHKHAPQSGQDLPGPLSVSDAVDGIRGCETRTKNHPAIVPPY